MSALLSRITIATEWIGHRNNAIGTRIVTDVIADTTAYAWRLTARTPARTDVRQFAERIAEAGLSALTAHDAGDRATGLRHLRQITVACAVLDGIASA